jgi:hypothetical protein
MSDSVTSAPYLSLLHYSEPHTLVVRWLRNTTLEELQNGYWLSLTIARSYGARHWYMDERRRAEVSLEAAQWIAETFLPAAAERFAPYPLHIAYITDAQTLATQRAEDNLHRLTTETLSASPVNLYVDTQEEAVNRWLKNQF